MSERKKFFYSLLIMAAGSMVITAITITVLYQTTLKEQRARLMETVFSQARLTTAIFQFASTYYLQYPEGAEAATWYQVKKAHSKFEGFGRTGELIWANRQNSDIHFLLELRHGISRSEHTVSMDSNLAQPMRRALAGESGTIIAPDYRGELVLAAYEPIKDLGAGIVAKIDMQEIRRPFQIAGIVALGSAAVIVLGISLLFLRISNPIIQDLEERTAHLSVANERLRKEMTARERTQEALTWELSVNSVLSELYIPLVAPQSSIEQIAQTILTNATQLTDSLHGYVSSIEPATGDIIGHTLTEMIKGQCDIYPEGTRIIFSPEKNRYKGLWGHALNTRAAFFTNSPAGHPSSIGLPPGHIPIHRLLSVPVTCDRELVGQITLANKQRDYTEQDLAAIKRIAEYYALAIQQRRTQQALQKAHDELEKRVAERTAQLVDANKLLTQKIADQQMAEAALKKSEMNLRRLSQKILDAHEEEQKRIGQELHDGLAQTMSAIKIWVENALVHLERENLAEVSKSLHSIVAMARAAVEDVRRISRNLRPTILEDLGILATISWLCNEFKKLYPDIGFEKQIAVTEDQVPEDLKPVIFRLLQEAMNNIAKHSEARQVILRLEKAGDRLELMISDDGVGFEVQRVSSEDVRTTGLGLTSMKERVNFSDGTFTIHSQKDSGTTIVATWHLVKKDLPINTDDREADNNSRL